MFSQASNMKYFVWEFLRSHDEYFIGKFLGISQGINSNPVSQRLAQLETLPGPRSLGMNLPVDKYEDYRLGRAC